MVKSKATQDFVPIREVRDGVIVLKDGSLRGVVMASSTNFALKSDDERQGIIMQFQNFLNTIDFSIQILIQSRRLNIQPYLALLKERQKVETADLMKIQISEYIEFVRTFTENTNIMSKSFFVVVPYEASVIGTKKNPMGFFKKKNAQEKTASADLSFEESHSQLEQRMSVVEQGLIRCGIRVSTLDTDSIVELFYRIFNPGDTEKITTPKDKL